MILTCPDCATSYFVDDSKIPADGRVVKCASCGARWTATPEEPALELEPVPDEPVFVLDPAEEPSEDAAPSELTGEDLPKVFRAKADTDRRVREAAATGIIWAGMAAVLAVMIAVAIIFRVDVVRLWPRTASAYAGVGLPVNSLGLVIEGVQFEPSLQEGHAALSVSGMIRNIEDKPVTTPPLRISLLNAKGEPVATKIARPADARIPPGETRHFAIAMLDPPASARELEVAFAPRDPAGAHGKPEAAAPAHDAPAKGPALRPATAPEALPAPVEAAPLRRAARMRYIRNMTDLSSPPEVLLTETEVAERVEALARQIAPQIDDDTVAVCLLTGGLWFASDLTRALSRAGRNVRFDALWLASYGDERASLGRCEVRADLQRPLAGRTALIIDDVIDTGLSLSEAQRLVRDAGASRVLTAVFATKPWPTPRAIEPDFVAWVAPARYLVGYGMDSAGALRGLPYIGALD